MKWKLPITIIDGMNLRTKDLNLLCVFNALWEERHLSQAAKKLALSQPATSNALSRLRTEFDDVLFTRSSKGMTPTELANRIAPQIAEYLNALEQVYDAGKKFDPSQSEEVLRLSVGDSFTTNYLPKFWKRLQEQAPNVKLVCHPDSQYFSPDAYERGEIHLCISGYQPGSGSLIEKKIIDGGIMCCYRKKNPFAKTPKSLKSYMKADHVYVSSTGQIGDWLDAQIRAQKFSRNIAIVTPGYYQAGMLLQDTDLILTCPTSLSEFLVKNYGLTSSEPPFPVKRYPIWMYWHRRTDKDLFHTWVRDLLQEVMNEPIS